MAKEEKVEGIGGWMILPIIGLFISIPVLLYDIISTVANYQISLFTGIVIFIELLFVIFIIIALVSIFNKKRYVPQLMVAFYIANFVFQAVVSFLADDYTGLGSAFIMWAIWIPFFLISERVKNTFVK